MKPVRTRGCIRRPRSNGDPVFCALACREVCRAMRGSQRQGATTRSYRLGIPGPCEHRVWAGAAICTCRLAAPVHRCHTVAAAGPNHSLGSSVAPAFVPTASPRSPSTAMASPKSSLTGREAGNHRRLPSTPRVPWLSRIRYDFPDSANIWVPHWPEAMLANDATCSPV